jgi:catechol 2,3-dioxygenase-like lactoylglutathione lyase family enzyme
MKPRITVLTLGVDDLDKAVAFYRDGLGWQTPGITGKEFAHGAVAFFQLSPGVQLALWARDDIAHDTGLAKSARSPTDFTLGHNVNSTQEVDEAMARARQAGAKVIKEAGKTFWGGYAGYFADPDGHVWEVVWNPNLKVSD